MFGSMTSLMQNRTTPVEESGSSGGVSSDCVIEDDSHLQLVIVWKISKPKASKSTKSKKRKAEPAKGSSDENESDDDDHYWSDGDHSDLFDEEESSSDEEVPPKLVDKVPCNPAMTILELTMLMIDMKYRILRKQLKQKRLDRKLCHMMIRMLFPKDVKPFKYFERMVTSFSQLEGMNPVTKIFCGNCKKSFSNLKKNCPDCKSKKIEQFSIFNLQPQLQKILPNLSTKLGADKVANELQELTLSLYKGSYRNINSRTGTWPLVLTIDELPEEKRIEEDTVLIAGFWQGDNANLEGFSEALHEELKKLKAGFLAGKEPGSSSDVLVTPDTMVFSAKEGTKKIKI